FDRAIGAGHDGKTAPAPTPGAAPREPAHAESAAPVTPASAEIPAMSQFRWYSYAGRVLDIDEVLDAAKTIASNYGFGGSPEKVTEPANEVKKLNGNHGYYWFKADGTPAWNGKYGTQYVAFVIGDGETSSKVNPLVNYLSAKPPGDRPETSAEKIG